MRTQLFITCLMAGLFVAGACAACGTGEYLVLASGGAENTQSCKKTEHGEFYEECAPDSNDCTSKCVCKKLDDKKVVASGPMNVSLSMT